MCCGMTTTADDATNHLATTADRLRTVRQAHERFLALWAVDHLLDASADRLADDADVVVVEADVTPDNLARPMAMRRSLFRGGRLDD